MITLNGREVLDICIDGVDSSDYPDFCDAYFCSAYFDDTNENLTNAELDQLAIENPELVYEMAVESFI